MPPDRLLVIDESLPDRLSTELTKRGRRARRLRELGLAGGSDSDVLSRLAKEDEDLVLVTADDRMPLQWGELIAELGITIATIDPRKRGGFNYDEWRREVVHRWAHAMIEQEHGTVRRYSLRSHRPWRPRVR